MAAVNPTGNHKRPVPPPMPNFYMPAMPPLGWLKAVKRWVHGRGRH